jgi:hypothetical protein
MLQYPFHLFNHPFNLSSYPPLQLIPIDHAHAHARLLPVLVVEVPVTDVIILVDGALIQEEEGMIMMKRKKYRRNRIRLCCLRMKRRDYHLALFRGHLHLILALHLLYHLRLLCLVEARDYRLGLCRRE